MGCGGSKHEAEYHGPPSVGSRPPAGKAPGQSDTDSDIRPRPVGLPSARVPDGRVNSNNPRNQLQLASPRGNLPLKRVDHIVSKAPAPPTRPPARAARGMFPKEYRNREGARQNPTHNFDGWEVQQRRNPADGRDMKLYEYPVKTMAQPPPFDPGFNFAERPAGLDQYNEALQVGTQRHREAWQNPPNDPGAIRAVTDKDGRVVGAMYHPEGNPRGYVRAQLEPLDRNGRAEVARYDERQLAGRSTWPHRGS